MDDADKTRPDNPDSERSRTSSVRSSFRSQTAKWLTTVLIALLTVFSSYLTEHIKYAINQADLRTKSFEELSQALSEYVFAAELVQEYMEQGWTTRGALIPLITDYNDAITTLRKNEYTYLSWLSRYWGKEKHDRFFMIMSSVRTFDQEVHSLNDEFEAVNIKKKRERVNKYRAMKAACQMRQTLTVMRPQVRTLLESSF